MFEKRSRHAYVTRRKNFPSLRVSLPLIPVARISDVRIMPESHFMLTGRRESSQRVHHAFIHIATFIRYNIARCQRCRSYSYEHIFNFTFCTKTRHRSTFRKFLFLRWENLRLSNLNVKYVIDTIQALNQVSVKITRRSESSVKSEILSTPEVKSVESFHFSILDLPRSARKELNFGGEQILPDFK